MHAQNDSRSDSVRAPYSTAICAHPSNRVVLDLRVVAEAAQPVNLRLAAKPGHLAFGVVAVSLLRGQQRLLARKFSAKELHSLLVSERRQRASRGAVLLN